jgi:HD-like signal output (HDOD) protein
MGERPTPALSRHIARVWRLPEQLPELIEAAEAVERLVAHPGYEVVRSVIEREVATIDRELDSGPSKEAADYAKQHGRRGALTAFDDAAKAIIGTAALERRRAEEHVQLQAAAALAAEEA